MFSREEKQKISKAVEDILLEINHPEMPKEKPRFHLHVDGKESWSWADILPNWTYGDKEPETTDWNENARKVLRNLRNLKPPINLKIGGE